MLEWGQEGLGQDRIGKSLTMAPRSGLQVDILGASSYGDCNFKPLGVTMDHSKDRKGEKRKERQQESVEQG